MPIIIFPCISEQSMTYTKFHIVEVKIVSRILQIFIQPFANLLFNTSIVNNATIILRVSITKMCFH